MTGGNGSAPIDQMNRSNFGFAPHASSAVELKSVIEAEREGKPFIIYRDDHNRQRLISLTETAITVGRRASNDIALEWDTEVSRAHAELHYIGGDWTIVDDGLSRNGTYLNGERLGGRRRLRDGDLVRCGQTALIFRAPREGSTAMTSAAAQLLNAQSLTPTQRRVLTALCRPYKHSEGFSSPATNAEVARRRSQDASSGALPQVRDRGASSEPEASATRRMCLPVGIGDRTRPKATKRELGACDGRHRAGTKRLPRRYGDHVPSPSFCAECGATLAGELRFCRSCGTRVEEAHPTDTPEPRPRSLPRTPAAGAVAADEAVTKRIEPLPAPRRERVTTPLPRSEPASRRRSPTNRQPGRDRQPLITTAAVALLALGVGGGLLASRALNESEPTPTAESQPRQPGAAEGPTRQRRPAEESDRPPREPPSRPDPSSEPLISGYEPFLEAEAGFATSVPTGPDWSVDRTGNQNTELNPRYVTILRGPDDIVIQIDATPLDAAQPPTDLATAPSRSLAHKAFGSMDEYIIRGGDLQFCEISLCVDYIIDDGRGGGLAVVGGGRDLDAVRRIVRKVAQDLRDYDT